MLRIPSILLAGTMIFLGSSLANAEPTKLRLGVIAASMQLFQSTPLYIAQEKGLFQKEGLSVDYVPLPGVDHMITALDRKTVDISSTATPYLVTGGLRGSDAVAIAGGPANTIYSIVTKPGIKDVSELRGKTVGLSLPQDMITVTARKILAKHGLTESDYTGKQLIGTPIRTKCLEVGECDAAPLSP
ncbi:MAG: ABC-type nitrate/sulfonate/bicarbonate transport system periplasmic component-like protein, partial [Hyphomicrobiales bacterium]|nr:ABC-type nitrate/sulfonate/bicarbonate transport system periplasmic component-like protein [Hyphomicrobiales bacterium]